MGKTGGIVEDHLTEILSSYKGERTELVPILQEVQANFGYLPEEAMLRIARFLRLPESTVYGVSTFYAQFKLTPTGRRVVKVCRGTACHVRGAGRILGEVEKRLGINPGETSDDLEYTLETIACFGSCALAPVMVIDKNVYGRVTPTKVEHILADTEERL